MAFNGSGVFQALTPPTFPAVAGETIFASRFNAVINDIINEGLSKVITRDGQSPPTNNLPMGGYKLTGLDVGVSDADSVNVSQSPVIKGPIGTADWDSLVSYGLWEATAASLAGPASHFPATSRIGQLLVLGNNGANIIQLYFTDINTWVRRRVAGVWTVWNQDNVFPDVDSNVDFGSSALRWQIGHFEGINFPASQVPSGNANTLDDYEEGSWTPTIGFDIPGDLSVTYGFNTGSYTKKGREVTIHASIATTTFTHTTASGSYRVFGIPIAASSGHEFPAALWLFDGLTVNTAEQIVAGIDAGAGVAVLFRKNNVTTGGTAGIDNTNAPTGVNKRVYLTVTYHT